MTPVPFRRPVVRRSLVRAALVALALLARADLSAQSDLRATLDSLARSHVAQSLVPGVSVAVVHRGDTLLLGGYGSADIEWDVPTPADGDAVYQIGSVTKQFTAAALLLLVERGEVDLDADVREYLPDYDTQGRSIPLRRLLDHTSGIKGYTEMPVLGRIITQDLPRDTLVALFEAEPFEFEPGAALIYNNSAYFLVGLIIEKVSGTSYEDFVARHFFEPLGMTRSSYCDEAAVISRRAHGYDTGPSGLRLKGYLDHQWPYAAGSLCSTVGDLVRWNQALHGGRVLQPESYRAMTTPMPLTDGAPVRYAMGLQVDERGGHRMIAHGGGINGFLSDGRYFPDDDLLVVVLQNSAGPAGPAALSLALVDAVLGPPPALPARTYAGDLSLFAGRYRGPARGATLTLDVSAVDGALSIRPDGSSAPPQALAWRDGLTWTVGATRVVFERGEAGVERLRFDQGSGHYVLERVANSR
ncbi:MAG: serine hydrolase domain-containing protein [Longimicrobiales bacterium]